MFASSFIESAGRDRKLLRASSFTALNLLFSRCTTRNFLNVDQTVWAQHTGLIFSDFEKFSGLQGREVWLSPFWRCAAVGEEVDLFGGAPHKGFLLDFKFHPGNSSPNAKKACCQRWSITGNKKGKIGETFGYPFAQSFSCARRVSIETHACFHLTKKAVFRPVVSRSAMSNKWIRESDNLL